MGIMFWTIVAGIIIVFLCFEVNNLIKNVNRLWKYTVSLEIRIRGLEDTGSKYSQKDSEIDFSLLEEEE